MVLKPFSAISAEVTEIMCGIAGIWSPHPLPAQCETRLTRALDFMQNRGPDDSGTFIASRCLLGHRRLAILDPQNARQPWTDSASSQVIVFNGEIYNFRELRSSLAPTIQPSTSTGDTAVLSSLLREKGLTTLNTLQGMFAFAWYDPHTHELLLARDHLGIKPLYYSWSSGILSFASTIPALLALTAQSPVANGVVVQHYLATMQPWLDEQSLIQGIYILPPGHYLKVAPASPTPAARQYWMPPIMAENEKPHLSWEDATTQCHSLIHSIVAQQMVSDVPVGTFLSGGLDSSVLASCIPHDQRKSLFAVSVGYEQQTYNEEQFVRIIADQQKIPCTSINLGKQDSWQDLLNHISYKGLPLSTPNEIAIYKLARAFSNTGKVALTGEGADEIFGGYALPQLGALDYDISNQKSLPSSIKDSLQRYYGRYQFRSRADHFLAANSWIHLEQQQQLIHPDLLSTWQGAEKITSQYEAWFNSLQHCSCIESYIHMHLRLNLSRLLERVDSATMAASVEARVPFTDHRLVEFSFQLPVEFKMQLSPAVSHHNSSEIAADWFRDNRIQTKRILRNAFKDQIPAVILNRPKWSFPSPFMESLANEWNQPATQLISESHFLRHLLKQPQAYHNLTPLQLWPLINLAIWAQQHNINTII